MEGLTRAWSFPGGGDILPTLLHDGGDALSQRTIDESGYSNRLGRREGGGRLTRDVSR